MDPEKQQLVILRVLAFAIDALGMMFLLLIPTTFASYGLEVALDSTVTVSTVWQVALGLFAVGILVRDGIGGRSPGKRLLALQISTPRGKRCGYVRSILRNLPLIVPGWNLLELALLLLTKSSRRSGDFCTRTTVEQE